MALPPAIVLDEDPSVLALARELLDEKEVETRLAPSWPAALDLLRARPVSLILADARAAGVDLAHLAAQAARLRPAAVVLVLDSRAGAPPALEAFQAGAFDVLGKPLETGRLRVALERALAQHRLLDELWRLREEAREEAGSGRLVGRSDPSLALREHVTRLAAAEAHVLLLGEPGTGKEHFARTLHRLSPRRSRPFVPVRCSALTPDAAAREFPGPGAGVLETAEGGTLFLDDLLELPPAAQVALASALERGGRGRESGAERARHDVRVVSATASDPERAVAAGRFREDLHRHLAQAVVRVPPLRDRVEDVLLLARHFIEGISRINDLPPLRLSHGAAEVLQRYRWPGNLRELRNAIEQAAILCREETVEIVDLPERIRSSASAPPATFAASALQPFREAKNEMIHAFEGSYLQDLMRRHRGSVTEAARHAGMLRSALQRLLRRHGLRSAAFREVEAAGPSTEPGT